MDFFLFEVVYLIEVSPKFMQEKKIHIFDIVCSCNAH